MEYQGVAIAEVVPESIAEEIGLEKGDYLYKINDQIVYDFLDYQYLCSEENLELYIRKKDGEEW
ncbi:MAG: PDZ domain-containing protein, partial [bacterium]